eukprot:TRINITY_DN4883_c0_g1_i3.p1 TRINITY_DN4883_c0_g1~~TRINITY_DN4883_c0_g1_i3.p1  ORF type:complete len:215 (-),score=47.86 TRINITY_DN4883_c0_g1_i3:896-1540(-)
MLHRKEDIVEMLLSVHRTVSPHRSRESLSLEFAALVSSMLTNLGKPLDGAVSFEDFKQITNMQPLLIEYFVMDLGDVSHSVVSDPETQLIASIGASKGAHTLALSHELPELGVYPMHPPADVKELSRQPPTRPPPPPPPKPGRKDPRFGCPRVPVPEHKAAGGSDSVTTRLLREEVDYGAVGEIGGGASLPRSMRASIGAVSTHVSLCSCCLLQ